MNKPEGKWLADTLKALGVTPYGVARLTGERPDKYYHHINNRSYLGAESLTTLATRYPKINLNYVLTGKGPVLL